MADLKIKRVINSLHSLERQILPYLAKSKNFSELVVNSKMKEIEAMRAFQWLQNKKIIEVSEKVAQNNLKSIKKLTEDLENLNVCLALDHYGVVDNYSTLLKHCDPDFLKIDASLIDLSHLTLLPWIRSRRSLRMPKMLEKRVLPSQLKIQTPWPRSIQLALTIFRDISCRHQQQI